MLKSKVLDLTTTRIEQEQAQQIATKCSLCCLNQLPFLMWHMSPATQQHGLSSHLCQRAHSPARLPPTNYPPTHCNPGARPVISPLPTCSLTCSSSSPSPSLPPTNHPPHTLQPSSTACHFTFVIVLTHLLVFLPLTFSLQLFPPHTHCYPAVGLPSHICKLAHAPAPLPSPLLLPPTHLLPPPLPSSTVCLIALPIMLTHLHHLLCFCLLTAMCCQSPRTWLPFRKLRYRECVCVCFELWMV